TSSGATWHREIFASSLFRVPVLDSGLRSTRCGGFDRRPTCRFDANCMKGDLWKVQKFNLQKPLLIMANTVLVPYVSKPVVWPSKPLVQRWCRLTKKHRCYRPRPLAKTHVKVSTSSR